MICQLDDDDDQTLHLQGLQQNNKKNLGTMGPKPNSNWIYINPYDVAQFFNQSKIETLEKFLRNLKLILE